MRTLALLAVLTLGCGASSTPPRAPAWASPALGGPANFVVAIDVKRLREASSRLGHEQQLSAQLLLFEWLEQVDLVGRLQSQGDSALAVALHGDTTKALAVLAVLLRRGGQKWLEELKHGSFAIKTQANAPEICVSPSGWVLTSGRQPSRAQFCAQEALERVDLSTDSVLEFALEAELLEWIRQQRRDEPEALEALEGAAVIWGRVRMAPEPLVELHGQYGSEEQARRAARALLWSWDRNVADFAVRLSPWRVGLRVEREGSDVHSTIFLSPNTAEGVRGAATPSPSPRAKYPSVCNETERYDLESGKCVELP